MNQTEKPEDLFEVAAEWWYRAQTDAAVVNAPEFLAWFEVPENATAFRAVQFAMASLGEFGATSKILDMRRSALARLQNAGARRWTPWRMVLGSVAAILVVTLAAGTVLYQKYQVLTYGTEVGERRVVALADGSRISLDSDTQVSVRYTSGTRAIVMDRGRARFDVAHDTRRPFTVSAGDETVVAVGTAFDVEKRQAKVLVTLIQGHVLIKDTGAAARPTIPLIAGQQMIATDNGAPVVTMVSLEAETAWETGHLVFRGAPLRDAVEQVNRYTDRPILVDPSVSEIKVSGVFDAGDVGSFVNAITGYFPVSATTNTNDVITLKHRP